MADEDEVVEMAEEVEEVEEEVAEMNVLDALKEVRFCYRLNSNHPIHPHLIMLHYTAILHIPPHIL